MIKRLLKRLFSIPLYILQLRKNKNVNISFSASIDLDTKFEGENIVNSNTILRNTTFGYGSYIGRNSKIFNASIGRFCSIGQNVRVISGKHPSKLFVSTHPAFYSLRPSGGVTFTNEQLFKENTFLDNEEKIQIIIGNDVWIADDVKILEGVKIGDGAIIATGAIVTKDVPDFAIVGGVPANIIRYRFNESEIRFLTEFKWWDKDVQWIKNNYEVFQNVEHLIDKMRYKGN